VERTSWLASLSCPGPGSGVVAHAGTVGLRMLADGVGLATELSKAMKRHSFVPVHDRGRVLADEAVMLADVQADLRVPPAGCGVTTPPSSSRACCGPGGQGRPRQPTTSPCSPTRSVRARLHRKRLLVPSDGVGASYDLLEWLNEQGRSAAGARGTASGSASPSS